jgi:thiamine biosynthesis lipoprotein
MSTMRRHLTILTCLLCATVAGAAERPVTFRTATMGTWAALTLVAEDSTAVAGVAHRALLALHRVDSLMSNWTTTSEIARLNREASAGPVVVQPEVLDVLLAARRVGVASDGAFDPTVEPLVRVWGFLGGTPRVPDAAEIEAVRDRVGWRHVHLDATAGTLRLDGEGVRMDLGGIAKGYGVDRVGMVLADAGVADALVDLSGNMLLRGSPPGRDRWRIGIRNPAPGEPPLGRLDLTDTALATSGNYEQFVSRDGRRYGHILDPRTGWPATGLESVTVVTARAMDADVWATALLVMGPDAARALAGARDDLAVVLLERTAAGGAVLWVETALRTAFTPAVDLVPELRFF